MLVSRGMDALWSLQVCPPCLPNAHRRQAISALTRGLTGATTLATTVTSMRLSAVGNTAQSMAMKITAKVRPMLRAVHVVEEAILGQDLTKQMEIMFSVAASQIQVILVQFACTIQQAF